MPRRFQPVIAEGTLRNLEQPTIETSMNTELRPWHDADAPAVRAAYDDPEITYWHARIFVSDAEALEWIRGFHERWKSESDATWAVVDETGELAGQIALRSVTLEFGQAEISYWTLRGSRGKGVATSALQALATWAFEAIGFHRLAIEHSVRNPASCRVATKAGFEAEGVLREATLHEDGWHDMHLHSRIREVETT
jgi:RimJ/RimL family protein N-acetyltransferase